MTLAEEEAGEKYDSTQEEIIPIMEDSLNS